VISFVGAGPGAADLITLRGRDRLAAADVVIWASSLVSEALLAHASPEAEVFDSAGMTLEDVVGVYAAARPGAAIVRLHSGDPSLYGAIGEQIEWCLANQRDFEIVPGVSSLAAAAAALGRELTVPGVAQTVILTRLPGRTAASMPAAETLAGLAAHGSTMAVFLSGARPEEVQRELLAGGGYGPDTPAAVVVRATWPDEAVYETTVAALADTVRDSGASRTVLVLVGEALRGTGPARSHLYSPGFAHAFRRRSRPGTTAGRPARPAPT
jgi:precorrin-4/cobalt-precorrin-4 C11-methyltransferase